MLTRPGANRAVAEGERGSENGSSVNRREGPAFNVSYRPFNVYYRPGEWQTYDIRLIGRDVTIVLNGKTFRTFTLTPLEKAGAKARTHRA